MPRVWGHAASSPSRVITHHSTAGTRPSLTALFEWEAVTLGDVAACVTTGPSAQTQFRNQTSSSIARTCTSTVCPILFRLPLQYSKFVVFKTGSKAKLLKFFTNKFTPPRGTRASPVPRSRFSIDERPRLALQSMLSNDDFRSFLQPKKPPPPPKVEASPPRPTRPRSWWSCARPKRSACSITMIVASGTSTPTSITVVATSTCASPD